MKVNGELYTFQYGGRGIDLRPDGYELFLKFYDNPDNPGTGGIYLKMPYKKTGMNVFSEFKFGNENLINEDLDSKVITNRSACFYASFSAKFINNEGEEMTITDGILSSEYDEPFDE